jgi:hypothetical protein
MIEAAFVLPVVTVGMIEVSAMRSPSMPRTRRLAPTTVFGSLLCAERTAWSARSLPALWPLAAGRPREDRDA